MTEGLDAVDGARNLKNGVDNVKNLHDKFQQLKDKKASDAASANQPEVSGAQNSASAGSGNAAPSVAGAENAQNAANAVNAASGAAANTAANAAAGSGAAAAEGAAVGASNAAAVGGNAAAHGASASAASTAASQAASTAAANTTAAASSSAAAAGGSAASGAASGAAAGSAGGPIGAAIGLAVAAVMEAIKNPKGAGGIIMGVVLIAFLPLFIIFAFLDWLNPFSTTNSTGGDNESAQGRDIEKDEGVSLKDMDEKEISELFEYYPVDDVVDEETGAVIKTGQYTFLAEVIKSAVADGYAWSAAQYAANKDSQLAPHDKRTFAETMYTFSESTAHKPSGKDGYYESAPRAYPNEAAVRSHDEDKNYYDEAVKNPNAGITNKLEPEEDDIDNNDYLVDNSMGGTFDSGTAYILAAYSVSKGDTAPPLERKGKDTYSYYKGLFELVNNAEALKHYFEYTGQLLSVSTTEQLTVKTLTAADGVDYDPVSGSYSCKQCCNNHGIYAYGSHDTTAYKVTQDTKYTYYLWGDYGYDNGGSVEKYAHNGASAWGCAYEYALDHAQYYYDMYIACGYDDATAQAQYDYYYDYYYDTSFIGQYSGYYCSSHGFLTGTQVTQTYKEHKYWYWKESAGEAQDFTYDMYSYHGNIAAFSYQDLLERMFLDDNDFYKDVAVAYSGDNLGSVTITASAEEILKEAKKSWPAQMDPKREAVVRKALSGIGNLVYIWGGGHGGGNNSYTCPHPIGVDCSGFVAWAYYQAGITDLGCHLACDYKNLGNTRMISASELKPGDICDSEGHVGIYVGKINGNVVYCHSSGGSANTVSNPGTGPCTNATSFFNFCTYTGFNDNQSYSGGGGATPTSDSNVTQDQLKVAAIAFGATTKGNPHIPGEAGYCAGWCGKIYAAAGVPLSCGNAIHNYCSASKKSTDLTKVPVGATVVISSHVDYGHIGIYIGDVYKDKGDNRGYVCHNWGGTLICEPLANFVARRSAYTKCADCGTQYNSFAGWCWCGPALGTGTSGLGLTAEEMASLAGGFIGGGIYSRAGALAAIMASPYYQWWTMYTYTCDHDKSVETKCPECGAKVKTHADGWRFWRRIYCFEYLKNDEPDKGIIRVVNDDGEFESEETIYSVSDKIDYFVEDILASIPNASAKYETGSNGVYRGVGSGMSLVEFALTQVGTNGAASWTCKGGWPDEWCAMFVSYCAEQVGYVDMSAPAYSFGNGVIPTYYACSSGANTFRDKGLWQWANSGYTPQPGDIIFFDWGGGRNVRTTASLDHTGIVEKCENGIVYTIEGNTGGSNFRSSVVSRKQYSVGSNVIVGYGTPEYPAVNLTGGDNMEKIFNFLVQVGQFTPAAACGVVANIEHESSFNPTALGDNGTSYGICQWHNSRWTNLKNYCNANRLDWHSLEGQLAFLLYELQNSYPGVYSTLKSAGNSSTDAYNCAYKWCVDFEVPADRYNKAVARGNSAKAYYSRLH